MIASLLRRILLPALVTGVASNVVLAIMNGEKEELTNVQSMGYLVAIALAGIILGGIVSYRLIAKMSTGKLTRMLALLVAGVITGVVIAVFLTWTATEEISLIYSSYGIAVGIVTAIVWMMINFDLLSPQKAGDIRG